MKILIDLLKNDKRIFANNKLLKNKLTELTFKLDLDLIELLLSNEGVKECFFVEKTIKENKVLIFDKDKFITFVNNKEFLPDSFTSFKNKIGLTTNGEYLREKNDVVLAWPYKDCVLEGGQDKEDQKRDEIFYNETLSPDEIDRLFESKVLTNFKRYNHTGEHKILEFNKDENLIIRGNNLLALHCLKHNFKEQVKLIYIDPPYSGGADDFNYNDKFNTSTWLTFIKNRIQIARNLLADDGAIFVQISDSMVSHLRLLMDEIFLPENFINKITVRTKSPSGFKVVNLGVFESAEYILSYAKKKKSWNYNPQYVEAPYDSNYCLVVTNFISPSKDWKFSNIEQQVSIENHFQSPKKAIEKLNKHVFDQLIADYALKNASKVFRLTSIGDDAGKDTLEAKHQSVKNKDKVFVVKRDGLSDRYILNGQEMAFYSKKVRTIDGKLVPTTMLTNIWTDIAWEGIASEGGVKLKGGKKPERLIRRIIDMSTQKGDLIMDFHLGSGTTCAVAHKMQRKYIGIEQLDYNENDSIQRITNVIQGEQTGVSKLEGWKDGGSFIYIELMRWNEKYMAAIKETDTTRKIFNIYEKMKKEAFFRYDIDLSKFDVKEFEQLALKDQKQILYECLDKNHLYVNLSDIEDATYNVSPNDKKLNKEFYRKII